MTIRKAVVRFLIQLLLLACSIHCPALTVAGDGSTPTTVNNVSVSPMVSINMRNAAGQIAGEVQSTVVPAGINKSCPDGRILITNDYSLSGLLEQGTNIATIQDVVTGHDLGSGGPLTYPSTFEKPYPNPQDAAKSQHRFHVGQDHDIITLKDGSVLLLAAGEFDNPDYIRYPTADKDGLKWAYFPNPDGTTARGPLARNGVYVWRSTDCGATFHWLSEIDPANFMIVSGVWEVHEVSANGAVVATQFRPVTKPTSGWCAMPQVYLHGPNPLFGKTDATTGVTTIGDASGNYTEASEAKVSGVVFKGYNQGGTDGPLAYVDMRGDGKFGEVYVTLGCVGNDINKDPNYNDPNIYDPQNPASKKPDFLLGNVLNKSIVFRSSDGGSSWMQVAELPVEVWRGSVAPLGQDKLAFYTPSRNLAGDWLNAAMIGTVQPNGGPVTFDQGSAIAPLDNYMGCWRDVYTVACEAPDPATMCVGNRFPNSEFVARGPRINGVQTLLFTHATKLYSPSLPGFSHQVSHGHGQSLLLYDASKNAFTALQPIAPRSHNPNDFAMHLTAIDAGDGTLLLYWLDIAPKKALFNNFLSKNVPAPMGASVTVIGRVLFADGTSTPDFVIAQVPPTDGSSSQVEYDWDPCSHTLSTWWGDYHTASGFLQKANTGSPFAHTVYRFFPMWIEASNGKANFTEVSFCRGVCEMHEHPLPPGAFPPK